jgi:repressor LexA
MGKKPLTPKELEALRFIQNKVIYRGQSPSVRDVAEALGYKSPRSSALVILKLIARGLIRRKSDGNLTVLKEVELNRGGAYTINIPLVGAAPCGAPLLSEENVEGFIPVSRDLAKAPHRYFLLRANGDSMNEAGIQNGDLVLCRQQQTAENGDRVVALVDDEATIKEFKKSGKVVVLRPKSKNKRHQPIIVTDNLRVQGVVVATVPRD